MPRASRPITSRSRSARGDLPSRRRRALPTKISKTTPCTVALRYFNTCDGARKRRFPLLDVARLVRSSDQSGSRDQARPGTDPRRGTRWTSIIFGSSPPPIAGPTAGRGTRPDRYLAAPSTRQSSPKAIVIAAQASPRPTSACHLLTAALSRLASAVSATIKSPWRPRHRRHLISRAFLHWRLSDDGPCNLIVATGRHTKPFTGAAVAGWPIAQPVYPQFRKYPVRSGTYASCHLRKSTDFEGNAHIERVSRFS